MATFTGSYENAIEQLNQLLTTLQNGINSRVFGEKIPLLGDRLANTTDKAIQFVENIRSAIEGKLNNISDLANATTADIVQALEDALDANGLGLLKQAINVVENTDEVVFDLKLGSSTGSSVTTALATDLGLPGLQFDLQGNANADLGFDLDLKLGVSKTKGFFIDTLASNELNINLNASAPSFNANGELGPLQLNATDQGSNFNGEFTVDLSDSSGRLEFNEVPDFSNLVDAQLTANADVRLNLATNFADAAKFPSFGTDFVLDWDFNAADIDDASFGELPRLSFNNVKLDLGSFLGDFAKPIVTEVRKITRPLEPVIDVITTPLPLLDKFGINISLLDIATNPAFVKGTPELGLIDAVSDIVDATAALDSIDVNEGTALINLGGFSVSDDIRQLSDLSNVVIDAGDVISPALDPLTQATGQSATASSFFAGAQGGGLSFPILESPTEAFKLLLGKTDATLFKADLPSLAAQFQYTQSIPVFPGVNVRFGGNGGFEANLDFGFDTTGLFAAESSGNAADIFNQGFFVDPNSGLNLNLGFSAGGGVGIPGAAELSADIFIDGTVDFKLSDPTSGDGKVRPPEIQQNLAKGINCVFDITGKVEAGAKASYELLFVFSDSFEIARFPIPGLNFAYGCSTNGNKNPILATDLGNNTLRLNMGPNAAARGADTPFLDEINEVFEVQAGANPGEVLVAAFGYVQPYPDISSSVDIITADGGTGDDVIVVQAAVTATADLMGGEGNDVLSAGGGSATLRGGTGNDGLNGSAKADQLFGEDGEDAIKGGADNDLLDGGAGNDILGGDAGADTLKGGLDADQLSGGSENDLLFGEAGDDRLSGGEGNDTLDGGTENDKLFGDEGSDSLLGADGNDEMNGGLGSDTLDGGSGDDILKGGFVQRVEQIGVIEDGPDAGLPIFGEPVTIDDLSRDILTGGTGNDRLEGNAGDDVLDGGTENDTLDGGTGSDLLAGSAGNDAIDGSSERDTVTYQTSPSGVTVNLNETQGYDNPGGFLHSTILRPDPIPTDTEPNFAITPGTALDGFGTTDTLRNLENIIGSEFSDVLIGNDVNNTIEALAGNDLLVGNAGDDMLKGGDGSDIVSYRRDPKNVIVNLEQNTATDGFGDTDTLNSIENVIGSAFDDQIIGDGQTNLIYAGNGNDRVEARGGSDIVFGESGSDTLSGEAGDDYLVGGIAADVLDGGDGNDTASYFTSSSRVAVSLTTGSGRFGDAEGDRLEFIENLEGSEFEDLLTGNELDNIISGLGGNDLIYGEAGNDLLDGGNGNDRLYGGEGNDQLYGQADTDLLRGEAGNDQLFGDEGNDQLYGEAGNDTLNGEAGNDYLEGGSESDQIFGDEGNDQLYGQDGSDTLAGGTGDDLLDGGTEADQLAGGDGNDQLYGQDGADTLEGGADNDLLEGGNGSDALTGDEGNDRLYGQIGEDTLNGSAGNDLLDGGDENDQLFGGDGNDQLYGQAGEDVLQGEAGNDSLYGGSEADTLLGQAGDDYLEGGTGKDTLEGGDDNDRLYGQQDDDTLSGNTGDDYLDGGLGDDELLGNEGNDRLYGQQGFDVLDGGAGSDFLDGGDEDDFLYGRDGSDRLYGTSGNDYLDGGADADRLEGGTGDDQLYGQQAQDYLDGGDGEDALFGGDAADRLLGQTGNDYLEGGTGDDHLLGGVGNDQLYGQEGSDTLAGEAGNDYLDGGDGNDQLSANEGNDFLYGQNGADTLEGGAGNDNLDGGVDDDQLIGGEGNDLLSGQDGQDILNAGAGDDYLEGGLGDDQIVAGSDNDQIYGGNGNDVLDAGSGNDYIEAGSGNDQLFGGDGNDQLSGQDGNDALAGGDGNDALAGGDGNDTLLGQTGDDSLLGDEGNDQLYGDEGNDSLLGGAGNDQLYAGEGDNLLEGGAGQDTLHGGSGRNQFVIGAGTGSDTIFDFVAGKDYFGLRDGLIFEQLTITQGVGENTDNTLISLRDSSEILASLIGVQANTLSQWDFVPV